MHYGGGQRDDAGYALPMEKVSGANLRVPHLRGYQALRFCRFFVYLKSLLAYGGSRGEFGDSV